MVTAGGDGNLLFNVGPMPDGRIEPRQVARLKEMGQWLGQYGESIYGTRGGPFKPGAWGVSTCAGKTIYVHVFEWSEDTVVLPAIDREIISATLLGGGKLTVKHTNDGITIGVPKRSQKKIDTVVKLILDGSAESIAPVIVRSASVASGKKVSASNVYQDQVGQFGADKAVDDDDKSRWATDAGTKQAQLEVDLGESFVINKAIIKEAYAGRVRKFRLEYKADGKWVSFHEGTTIGERAVIGFEPVTARYVRLNILDATEGPTIWEFQLLSRK